MQCLAHVIAEVGVTEVYIIGTHTCTDTCVFTLMITGVFPLHVRHILSKCYEICGEANTFRGRLYSLVKAAGMLSVKSPPPNSHLINFQLESFEEK